MPFHPLTVARLDRSADDAVAITLAVPPALRGVFRHVPGQHLTVRHAGLRRTYSLCSPAGPERGEVTIGVRLIPGGAFSTHAVTALAAGDRLDVMPPRGRFTLRPAPGHYAAVAGGSGITPVLSMAASLLAARTDARFTLLRSDRTAGSAMFLDEVADLKDRHPGRFQLAHALTREERQAGPASGRLDAARLRDLLAALVPPDAVTGWYLCGPPGLIDASRSALRALGVPPERVRSELFLTTPDPPATLENERSFSDSPPHPAPHTTTLTALLDGRGTTCAATPGEPLLSALLRARPDAPYACRGGVCGTCRARLTEGRVHLARNDALEDDELAAGYVLACQAQPLTDHVALDFDA
ncbi:2Fe-2S iron-sulfur cluster-binding protein [Streptomyces avicenniae]|uniref:2Fe-2S iron-sulfur cluster-binding protein n=1 Tax=Streptomyces avicenniae TaxID=500153 RepID=UPI00069B7E50|nr:2Fe-2S iron-sulfur cluster-binding protein [Streptomyces avicenniae]